MADASITAVCRVCNDTHMMQLGESRVMCTHCPVPCQRCRQEGNGPYCEITPCDCDCHVSHEPEEQWIFWSDRHGR